MTTLTSNKVSTALAQVRRLYLHALHGGVVTAQDMSHLVQLLERIETDTLTTHKKENTDVA